MPVIEVKLRSRVRSPSSAQTKGPGNGAFVLARMTTEGRCCKRQVLDRHLMPQSYGTEGIGLRKRCSGGMAARTSVAFLRQQLRRGGLDHDVAVREWLPRDWWCALRLRWVRSLALPGEHIPRAAWGA